MKVAVLIPAYNEEKRIAGVVVKAKKYVEFVLVVDDGSLDLTAQRSRDAGAQVIEHITNKGKGAAIKTGFNEALKQQADAVIILDGDGQHDTDEIPDFIRVATQKKADMVIGNRMENPEGMPLIRYLTNKLTSYLISKVARATISDTQCGYRLIRTWLVPKMHLKTTLYDTESEMLLEAARLGALIENVPVKSIYGDSESHIRKIRDTIRFFKLLWRYRKKSIKKPQRTQR